MSNELTPEELDRLVALREAATKGPWSESFRGHSVEVNQSGGENIAILHLNEPSLLHRQAESNAAFIAAIVNAFPALVAMARRVSGKCEACQRIIDAVGCEDCP